jgi:hypothetical protein
MPSLVNTSSNTSVYLLSRSQIKNQEQHVDTGHPDCVDVQEVAGQDPLAWVVRNWVQVGPVRRGAGSIPALVRMDHTVLAATR